MTQPYIGEIRVFPWPWAMKNWALCQGQLLSIAQNQALFSLLGTVYGGNGIQTFALPDLRGRVAPGMGQLPGGSLYTLGEVNGTETVTLTTSTMPMHNHLWQATTTNGNQSVPSGGYLAQVDRPPNVPAYTAPGANAVALGTPIANSGDGQAHPNIQPFTVMNYSICLYGIFPSRN